MLRSTFVWCLVVAAVPIALLRPFIGLLIYLVFAHGHIADFVWSDWAVHDWGMLIAGATLVGYLLFEMRRSPLRFHGLILLLAFWLWLAFTCLFAYDGSLALSKLIQYSRIFVVTILIASMANSESRVRTILATIGVSLGLLGSKGALDFFLTGGRFRMMGPGGMLADENEYALGLDLAIPILFYLASTEHRRWVAWCYRMMMVACGIVVIGTRSRSGFLGLCLAVLLLVIYSRRKTVGFVVLGLTCLTFFVIAPQAAVQRYQGIPDANERDASAEMRLAVWHVAAVMIRANPVVGVGLRNFETAFPRYSNLESRAPHNAYLALAAEAGIPACLLFLLMIGAAIRSMAVKRRRLRKAAPENWRLANYCLAIQISLTVYLVPNFFINRQDQDLMYHLIGVAAGLGWVAMHRLLQLPEEETAATGGEEMVLEPTGV